MKGIKGKRPKLADFINEHRQELSDHIRAVIDDPEFVLSYNELRSWVLNDESLYKWARKEGVRI
jgi:hypothetical protein